VLVLNDPREGNGAAAAPRVSHGGWSDNGEVESLCFHAGAAPAGHAEGTLASSRHTVGLVRLRRGEPQAALALAAPAGQEVVDAAVYTDGRLLLLLQPAAGSGGGGGGGGGGGEGIEVGPGTYCSPPHRMSFNSRNEGSKRVG